MKYNEFFWKHIDTLSSDTSLAHSFGEKVWNHQQQEIDDLKDKLQKLMNHFVSQKNLPPLSEWDEGYSVAYANVVEDLEKLLR